MGILGDFLKKLQSSPEEVKIRWLVGLTAFAMIGVIYVWAAYFDTLITAPTAIPAEPRTEDNFSFWVTMKRGGTVIVSSAADLFQSLGAVIFVPKEYVIVPGE